jgi:hypothetical protein
MVVTHDRAMAEGADRYFLRMPLKERKPILLLPRDFDYVTLPYTTTYLEKM